MRINRYRYIVAFINLLVFLLTGQAAVQGYVLCLGEDGHAALEYADENGCGPVKAASAQQSCREDLHDLEPEHCGPCVDVPSWSDFASRRHLDLENSSPPAALTVIPPYSIPAEELFAAVRPHPAPPRPSQALLVHRTVVLLH